jgi:hypothetical protein
MCWPLLLLSHSPAAGQREVRGSMVRCGHRGALRAPQPARCMRRRQQPPRRQGRRQIAVGGPPSMNGWLGNVLQPATASRAPFTRTGYWALGGLGQRTPARQEACLRRHATLVCLANVTRNDRLRRPPTAIGLHLQLPLPQLGATGICLGDRRREHMRCRPWPGLCVVEPNGSGLGVENVPCRGVAGVGCLDVLPHRRELARGAGSPGHRHGGLVLAHILPTRVRLGYDDAQWLRPGRRPRLRVRQCDWLRRRRGRGALLRGHGAKVSCSSRPETRRGCVQQPQQACPGDDGGTASS